MEEKYIDSFKAQGYEIVFDIRDGMYTVATFEDDDELGLTEDIEIETISYEEAREHFENLKKGVVMKTDTQIETKEYQIWLRGAENNYYDEQGYFEHKKYGDELGGGLWFKEKELADFDGVMILPAEVADELISLGYIVDKELCCE